MPAEKPPIPSFISNPNPSPIPSPIPNPKPSSSLQSIFHKNRKLWKRSRKHQSSSSSSSSSLAVSHFQDQSEPPIDFNTNSRINPIFCSEKSNSFDRNFCFNAENYVLDDRTFESNMERMNLNYSTGGSSSSSSSLYSSVSLNSKNDEISHGYGHRGRSRENQKIQSDEDYWVQLQTELLSAECKLLKAEKELVLRKWRQGYDDEVNANKHSPNKSTDRIHIGSKVCEEKMAELDGDGDDNGSRNKNNKNKKKQVYADNGTSSNIEAHCDKLKQFSTNFAHEALKRLNDIHNSNGVNHSANYVDSIIPNDMNCPSDLIEEGAEDPTQALQERLQNLLLVNASSSSSSPCPSPSACSYSCHTTPSASHGNSTLHHNGASSVDNNSYKSNCDSSLEHESTAAITTDQSTKQCMMHEQDSKQAHKAFVVPEPEVYCKATIRRIVEQMRAESEHWSQMQDVLRSLQDEMSTMSEERGHWEKRALRAEAELLTLHQKVHEMHSQAKKAEQELAALQQEKKFLMFKLQSLKQHNSNKAARHIPMERRITSSNMGKIASTCHGTHAKTRDLLPPLLLEKDSHDDENKKMMNLCGIVGTGALGEKPHSNITCYSVVPLEDQYSARICESYVHSRNESSRSSIDLGHPSYQKVNSMLLSKSNIKKSLAFDANGFTSNESHVSLSAKKKSSRGNYSRLGHTYHRLFNKVPDVNGLKADYACKNHGGSSETQARSKKVCKPSSYDNNDGDDNGSFDVNVDVAEEMGYRREQKIEKDFEYHVASRGTTNVGNVERKKARLINLGEKENRSANLIPNNSTCHYEGGDGFMTRYVHVDDDTYRDYFISSKSSVKSPTIPTAPTSTPSKFPFAEVMNNIPTSSTFKI